VPRTSYQTAEVTALEPSRCPIGNSFVEHPNPVEPTFQRLPTRPASFNAPQSISGSNAFKSGAAERDFVFSIGEGAGPHAVSPTRTNGTSRVSVTTDILMRSLYNPGMLAILCGLLSLLGAAFAAPRTVVSIQGDRFFIDGQPTYKGRTWQGHKIEGLLLNSRMVQGIFDDANSATAKRWAYKDSGKWDAERNTREFLAAMPEWRKHGLLAITLNLQGGSPEGYSKEQPWNNTAIGPDGSLCRFTHTFA
jgi:hypothetical protein